MLRYDFVYFIFDIPTFEYKLDTEGKNVVLELGSSLLIVLPPLKLKLLEIPCRQVFF